MKKYLLVVITAAIVMSTGSALLSATSAQASPADEARKGVTQIGGNKNGNDVPLESRFKTIVNALLFVIAAVAVVMIIIGAIRLVVSGGEAANVKSAKNIILYAVVGLIVALLALAVVTFVNSTFTV